MKKRDTKRSEEDKQDPKGNNRKSSVYQLFPKMIFCGPANDDRMDVHRIVWALVFSVLLYQSEEEERAKR